MSFSPFYAGFDPISFILASNVNIHTILDGLKFRQVVPLTITLAALLVFKIFLHRVLFLN